MLRHAGSHIQRNLVAYLALFVALGGTSYAAVKITGAQIQDGSITGSDIRDHSLQARDIRAGSLRANLFAPGVLGKTAGTASAGGPQGPQGPKGDTGPAGPAGPSFGESILVPNKKSVPCGTENVMGQQTITVTRTSRILAFGNGAMLDNGAPTTTYGLWLRLRDAADTQTLAVSTVAWDFDDGAVPADKAMPLSVSTVMLSGPDPEFTSGTFVAQPGTYRLQLIAVASEGTCTTTLPNFGINGGGGMGYVILGNG